MWGQRGGERGQQWRGMQVLPLPRKWRRLALLLPTQLLLLLLL